MRLPLVLRVAAATLAPALRDVTAAALAVAALLLWLAASGPAGAGSPDPGAAMELAVEVSGSGSAGAAGTAVVLVPGLMGCAYGYRHVVEELNRGGLQTIVLEPLGVGGSPRPAGADYSLAAQAGRIGVALDALGVKQAIVVAHGAAAGMALRLALERPGLVGGIVSLEGGATETAATPGLRRALDLAGLACKLGGKHILRERLERELRQASGDPSWVEGVTFRRYFGNYGRDTEATIAALRAMTAAREPSPLAPRLRQVDCPVVLLVGEAPHDGGVDPAEIARLEAGLPDLTIRRLPGCGHYVMEEQPAAVVAAVRALAPAALARAAGGRD